MFNTTANISKEVNSNSIKVCMRKHTHAHTHTHTHAHTHTHTHTLDWNLTDYSTERRGEFLICSLRFHFVSSMPWDQEGKSVQ